MRRSCSRRRSRSICRRILPDDYITSQDAKLDIYRRLTHMTDIAEIEALREEVRDRFGVLPDPARAFFAMALLRVLGGASDIESVLVRGNEARITFREHAVPRMKGISAAFHEVQFQAEVRRAHPLSLKLTRLGGAEMLEWTCPRLDDAATCLTTVNPHTEYETHFRSCRHRGAYTLCLLRPEGRAQRAH